MKGRRRKEGRKGQFELLVEVEYRLKEGYQNLHVSRFGGRMAPPRKEQMVEGHSVAIVLDTALEPKPA